MFFSHEKLDFKQQGGNTKNQCNSKQIQTKENIATEFGKVFCLNWNNWNNMLFFMLNAIKIDIDTIFDNFVPTKRQVLSFVRSTYDPFCLVAYFIVPGKILLRNMRLVWQSGIKWESQITATQREIWLMLWCKDAMIWYCKRWVSSTLFPTWTRQWDGNTYFCWR